jgi:phosphonate transport system permease protein
MVVRMKSMNRMKVIRRITTLVMLFIIIFCFAVTGFDMNVIINRGSQAVLFIKRMFPPDTGYCGKIIEPLIKTVQMSIAGTFIGAVFGLFTAFLYAGNLIKKSYVRIVVRVIVQCVRTIPVLILALVATFIWGLGAAAGTIAIAVSTWAVMARIGGEDIEGMTLKPYEAVTAIGAGKFKAFSRTVIIELLPGYLSNSLYVLEANIRHAAILGYIGAGGIGLLLNEKISWREYSRVGMILVMLFVAVLVVEGISTFLKAYLDGRIKRNTTANVIISVCIMVFFVYSLSAVKDVSTSKLGIKVVGAIMHGITHPNWQNCRSWNFQNCSNCCHPGLWVFLPPWEHRHNPLPRSQDRRWNILRIWRYLPQNTFYRSPKNPPCFVHSATAAGRSHIHPWYPFRRLNCLRTAAHLRMRNSEIPPR